MKFTENQAYTLFKAVGMVAAMSEVSEAKLATALDHLPFLFDDHSDKVINAMGEGVWEGYRLVNKRINQ